MLPDLPSPGALPEDIPHPARFPARLEAFLEGGGLAGEWLLALDARIAAAAACAPLSVDLLTRGELACYRGIPDQGRRAWLTGRAAVRRLSHRLGIAPPDPSGPRAFALARSESLALAFACPDAGLRLGACLEPDRPLAPSLDPFFLADPERKFLARMEAPAEAQSVRLRLWTAKAALRSADRGGSRRSLFEYRIPLPSQRRGKAAIPSGAGHADFRYVTHRLAGWRLALAAGPA